MTYPYTILTMFKTFEYKTTEKNQFFYISGLPKLKPPAHKSKRSYTNGTDNF